MATDVVTAQSNSPAAASPAGRKRPERSVADIITAARTAPAKARCAWALAFGTALLVWASFPPLDLAPLAFVALVPLLMLVRPERRPRWTYRASYVAGAALYLGLWQWMRLGDDTMYVAWVALALYFACYVPVFLWLCRTAVLRFRLPLVAVAPVCWTGLELVRAHLITGQAWYFLGHTQYRWLELIQISDLFGAYAVSFLVVASAAVLAMLAPISWYARMKLVPADVDAAFAVRTTSFRGQWWATGLVAVLFAAALGYGSVRRSQATWTRADASPGPRMAMIQGNFTATARGYTPEEVVEIRRTHYQLTGVAVKHQPDVVVWPEAMFPYPPIREIAPGTSDEQLQALTPDVPVEWWRDRDARGVLADMAKQANAAMIVGLTAYTAAPGHTAHYNSAAFLHPSLGYQGRYDKLHRVPFGEYLPLRDELPFLARFTPYGFGAGIAAGDHPAVFEFGEHRYTPIICFESTVPHLVRRIVNETRDEQGAPVDVLVTLSNDGWFHGSSGLDQHLITSAFRCVETRTPMACAVNTGLSAFIDGDGAIVEPDVFVDADGGDRESFRDGLGRPHRQLNAVLVHDVPLDGRTSLYVAYGDWFAFACLTLVLFITVLAFLSGTKRTPATSSPD